MDEMIKWFHLLCLLSFTHYHCQSQQKIQANLLPLDSLHRMKSMSFEEALKNPTKAYRVGLDKEELEKIHLLKNANVQYIIVGVKQGISEIPKSIGKLTNLQVLTLTRNNLKALPKSIGRLKNLKELDLSHNKLIGLPHSLGKLKSLEVLKLANNQLSRLPQGFGKLTNLKQLYLGKNEIKSFSSDVAGLKNLHMLNLAINNLTTLPHHLEKVPVRDLNLAGNRTLNLSGLSNKLKNLKALRLSHITVLPSSFKKLYSLKVLEIIQSTDINLEQITPILTSLPSLQSLSLSGMQNTRIPVTFGNFKQLEKLGIQLSSITNLAKAFSIISQLSKLKQFALAFGDYPSLPAEVGLLTNIEELYLPQNKTTDLPDDIGKLAQLKVLSISYNEFKFLPKVITSLTQLKRLGLNTHKFSKEEKLMLKKALPNTEILDYDSGFWAKPEK